MKKSQLKLELSLFL